MMKRLKALAGIASQVKTASQAARSELDALRVERAELLLKRSAIERQPVDEKTIETRVDALIRTAEGAAAGVFADHLTTPRPHKTTIDMVLSIDKHAFGSMCLLGMRETFRANMIEAARASLPAGVSQLSDDDRSKALAQLDAELHAIEVAEEQLIRDAEEAGIELHRRTDANPEIFLAASLS